MVLISRTTIAAAAVALISAALPASAAVVTAGNYTSAASIPLNFYAGGSPTFLDTLEDKTLDGGITASAGAVLTSGGLRDSVDGDDGVIDGSGSAGFSFARVPAGTGITFTFSSLVTAAGLVWTDGAGATTFSAFDAMGMLIDTLTVTIAGNGFSGQTAEDTFFGVTSASGIKSIFVTNASGGIEVDHIQYGNMHVNSMSTVPLPAGGVLLLGALAGLAALRRRVGA